MKARPNKPSTIHWRCDLCGCTGSSTRKDTGAWDGAELILMWHHSVAPECKGDAFTIRVSLKGPVR